MTSADIREAFLAFFEKNGHTRVTSSSLVPIGDPTLFFTNAGMVQFKSVFLGEERRSYIRACTSQKCMRVSGKHNDLENVGHTPRHHTFFEMLGNFSFGDYFKKEAIAFAWEFLTKQMKLDPERMIVTVFRDDDDAATLWEKHVAPDRIFRLGEKDNFWAMGETGPCGPCSEIHWDWQGGAVTATDLETDRFMELWNLVFMQYNRTSDQELKKLSAPSIDTGMGLERLAAVMQGVKSNWETDLFTPLVATIEKVTGKKQNASADTLVAMRVIADHVRAATFLIADGVFPANDGRGYVLRRILRRAIRSGRRLDMHQPFFAKVAQTVIDEMGSAYPELLTHQEAIQKILTNEEERFIETLERGLKLLEEEISNLRNISATIIPGSVIFKLYDTFGFPKDLTELIAREKGFSLDEAGFEKEMVAQKERARKARKGSAVVKTDPIYQKLRAQNIRTTFVGYEKESSTGEVVTLVHKGKVVRSAKEGDEVELVVDATPFYAEGGGQVGDTGSMLREDAELKVCDTQKPFPDLFVHHVQVVAGEIKPKQRLILQIDSERRFKIKCHHTATHLLNAALRQVLGTHVKQAGSYLDDAALRFDFSHFSAVTDEQLTDIEAIVNQVIAKNLPITTAVLPYAEAVAKGALAFFGEKYGALVRMVQIGDFSRELCGGTHLAFTSEMYRVKIVKERSVASGVRRIEALAGPAARQYTSLAKAEVRDVKKAKPERVIIATELVHELLKKMHEVRGVNVVVGEVSVESPAALREIADRVKQKIGSGIVVLGANIDGKAALITMVSDDLTARIKAGAMMAAIVPIVGGKGGGRPDMAQGGGPDVSRLDEALTNVAQVLARFSEVL